MSEDSDYPTTRIESKTITRSVGPELPPDEGMELWCRLSERLVGMVYAASTEPWVEKLVEGEIVNDTPGIPILRGHDPSRCIGRAEKLPSGEYRFVREKAVEGEVLDSDLGIEDAVGEVKRLPAPSGH